MVAHKRLMQEFVDSVLSKNNSKVLAKEKYDQIVSALKSGDCDIGAMFKWTIKNKGYALVNFPELNLNDVLCVPAKKRNENDPTILSAWRIQVHSENVVDILSRVHWSETNHVGYKKLTVKVQSRYEGIPRSIIQETCRTCPVCLMSTRQTNNAELKPILSSGFLTRAQIDLIDMRHTPDGEYHYIAHFMDHWSKFHIIWPLKRKTAEEVASGLNERVFPYVGLPRILHSDNGREFVNKLVRELVKVWGGENDVLFINGRPRHSQSQGLVEQGNATIERHIANKRATLNLVGEESYPWASWLPKIMYNMNTEVAAGIQKMPYEVVFGQPPRTTIFPGATVEGNIVNEEDIEIDIQETIPPHQVSGTSFSPSHSASANTSETLREIPIPGLCSVSTPPEPHRERQIPVPCSAPTPPEPLRERPIPGTCSASTPPELHIERPIPIPCSAPTPPEPLRELPIQSTCSASTRPDPHRERPIPGTCLASTPSEPLRERPIPKPRRMKPVSNTDVPQASDYSDSNRPALEREVTHTILSTYASSDLPDVTSFPSASSKATEVSRETTLPLPLAFAQLSRQPPTVLSISPACEANEATRTILTPTPMFEHSNSEQSSPKSEGSGNAPSKSHPLRSTHPSSLPSTVCAPDLPPSFPDVSMPSVIASTASPSYTLATNTKHHQIRQEADKAYRRNAESMKQKYSKRKRTTCTSFEVGTQNRSLWYRPATYHG